MSDDYDILDWLGGKGFRKLKRHNKTRKISERADNDNGNDDKSSQDYIPMEKVSREYVKVKQQEEDKKLRKGIRDSMHPRSESARNESQVGFDDDAAMEPISREYLKVKKQKDSRETQRAIREAIDPEAPSVKKKKETAPEAAMDEPAKEYEEQKEHYNKLKRNKQIKEQLEKQDPDYKPSAADIRRRAQQAAADKLKASKITDSEVEGVTPERSEGRNKREAVVPKDPIAPQLTALQPPGAADFTPQGSTAVDNSLSSPEPTAPVAQENSSIRAPAARVPSLVGQLPPTELEPVAAVPGGNGELKGIEVNDPPDSRSLPLQLDVPADTGGETKSDPVLDSLSAEYQRATNKPISVLGANVDPATRAYDAADRTLGLIQSFNSGMLKAPTGVARLGSFLSLPFDKAFGTDSFGKTGKQLDSADKFIDSFGVTKDPTNVAERAFNALGIVALPLPGGPATNSTRQFFKEALLPGTYVREGQSLAGAYGVSATGAVPVNEGLFQIYDNVVKQDKRNPPVENKYSELEPRVLSVDGKSAKDIQQKLDADARSFIPKFAEANYADAALYTAGAAAAIAALYYRGSRHMKAPVSGRTILNPEKPIIEQTPQSITTAKEVTRTANQDANYGLMSQANRFENVDLLHDLPTSTRAGMASRMESMIDTGLVNTPGYSTQLSASLKQLSEFHLKRPEAEQQEVSRAFHILNQVDDAKVASEKRAANKTEAGVAKEADVGPNYSSMPPEPDIRWATDLLAKPENAGVVRMMNEIRTAKAKVAEAAGVWDSETANTMLGKRPNYVHRIETDDYKVVDGQTVPKTRQEAMIDGLRSKQGDTDYLHMNGADLGSTLERSRVNAPNQMMDAVIANISDLQKTATFAYENDIRKRFAGIRKTHPEFEKSIMQLKEGDKVPKGYETFSYYDNGQKMRFAAEPSIAAALKFNPTTAASRYNTATMVRNAFQQATTGPVLAPFFAPTAFAMESSLIAATRSRGMRVGNIDAALQSVTGGRGDVVGDMFGTMSAGVGAVFRAQRADNLLHSIQKTEDYLLRYGNRNLQDLETQIPGVTKKIAKGLAVGQDATVESILAENRRLYAETAKGWALKNGALHASQNEMMRNANRFYAGDVLEGFQRALGQEGGLGWWQYYKNLVLNIHDGPRLALVEANRGKVPDKQLAYETRKASGDLGVRGAGNVDTGYILSSDTSKAAQAATKIMTGKFAGGILDRAYASIPYINPHMQGTTRFLEQVAKQPITTIAGAINSTTAPMLGTLGFTGALAAAGHPEYLDYFMNKREEYKKTGYIYVPIPGRAPEDGLEFRIDPVLAPFGYPAVEAVDSVFGVRKLLADMLGRKSPNAETQGLASALSEGLKEAIGFGMPIDASLALATQGTAAARNVFDSSFNVKSEQASKLGTGKNAGSALSVPMQMILENILGATAQHAIAGMDAFHSTGKKESALLNAAKGASFSFASKAPVVGTMLAGKNFNESATALADNTRKLGNSARRIVAGIENTENILLKSANAQAGAGNQTPQIKMGNPGITQLPPEVQDNMDQFKLLLRTNGRLKGINSERSSISTSLTGLRGVNAGNLARHVLVPLKEGREIGGLGYTILNEELMKQELAKEEDSIINPKMTKGGATRAPKEAKRQRSTIVQDLVGGVPKVKNNKVESPEGSFYKPPSLKQVQALKNALNERRYTLDLEAADEYEGIEKQLGVKLNDVAKKVKLTPEAEGELSSE